MAAAAPKSELWPRWEAHDPAVPALSWTTRLWSRLAGAVCPSEPLRLTRFDYAGLQQTRTRCTGHLLEALSATPFSRLNAPPRRAIRYWLNFYNCA